jgi:hypothetical protein
MLVPTRELTIRTGLLLAALTLVACGNDEPAEPSVEQTDAELLATPSPSPVAAAEPGAEPDAEPSPTATPEMLQPTPRTITPEEVGNTPVKNVQEAFGAAQKAITRYCELHTMPCETFYIKETISSGDNYQVLFFGAPNGQGMYLTAIVHPDGSTEIAQ